MKCAVAGVTGGSDNHMTPFKRTMNKSKAILTKYGECHIAELIKIINSEMGGHHYSTDSSAKNSIGKFLVDFGIADKQDHRPVYRLKGLTDKEVNILKSKVVVEKCDKQGALF